MPAQSDPSVASRWSLPLPPPPQALSSLCQETTLLVLLLPLCHFFLRRPQTTGVSMSWAPDPSPYHPSSLVPLVTAGDNLISRPESRGSQDSPAGHSSSGPDQVCPNLSFSLALEPAFPLVSPSELAATPLFHSTIGITLGSWVTLVSVSVPHLQS